MCTIYQTTRMRIRLTKKKPHKKKMAGERTHTGKYGECNSSYEGPKKNHDAGSECVYSLYLTKKQNGGGIIVVHAYFIRYGECHSL